MNYSDQLLCRNLINSFFPDIDPEDLMPLEMEYRHGDIDVEDYYIIRFRIKQKFPDKKIWFNPNENHVSITSDGTTTVGMRISLTKVLCIMLEDNLMLMNAYNSLEQRIKKLEQEIKHIKLIKLEQEGNDTK